MFPLFDGLPVWAAGAGQQIWGHTQAVNGLRVNLFGLHVLKHRQSRPVLENQGHLSQILQEFLRGVP
jgi:hypothetical protein